MNSNSSDWGRPMSRRQFVNAVSATGFATVLPGATSGAEERKENGGKAPMLPGIDTWSLHLAFGKHKMTVRDLLAKLRQWGLKGAQVGLGEMPKLDSNEFESLRKTIADAGLYWEVSAGMVQDEAVVLQALEYNAALGSKVVRAFIEGFGIQFQRATLDEYVTEAMSHITNLLPKFEQRGLYLCLENHGGLRMRHYHRVLKAFPSEHLGMNLDTGNPLLTLEDPVEVVKELAPRTYTCHLKDWNLIGCPDGLIVRGCALGEGVVDLKAVVGILRAKAPLRDPLHLNIEAPQEYIPLKLFTAEFWRWHGEVTGRELGNMLRLAEKRNMPGGDYRIASMRGEPESVILAEEEAAIAQSVRYCRDVLQLL